jgi:hypothetical protein
MDLRALEASHQGGERYHPFGALVEVGNQVSEHRSELVLMGLMPVDQYFRVSTIFHEITHVASMRTTRLGVWIAGVSSELMQGKLEIPSAMIRLPPQVQIVLGAYAPILEGLAIYAQLDYEIYNIDGILPFSINKIAINNSAGWLQGYSPQEVGHRARLTVIWDGILSALLIDNVPGTIHYRAGYLYLKGVAAKITRLAPTLSKSTTMLPLLVRLFCDHPIVERALNEPLSASQIAEALHDTVANLDEPTLKRIEEMLKWPEVIERFDNWDIHAQIQAPDGAPGIFHSDADPIFERFRQDPEVFLRFRGATDAHLTSWAAGLPKSVEYRDGHYLVELTDGSREVTAKIMVHSAFNLFRRNMTDKSLQTLESFEQLAYSHLERAGEQKLPIAVGSYVTLTKGTVGTVLWVDNVLCGVIPLKLVDNELDPDEVQVAMTGNRLSPAFRQQLVRKLECDDDDTLGGAIREASELFFAKLISDPRKSEIGLYSGLSLLLLTSVLREAFDDWCRKTLSPGGPPDLDPSVITALSQIFDRPGVGSGSFDEPLPDLRNLQPIIGGRG